MENYVVRGTLATLFYISRALGVAPLKFEYTDGGYKATVSRWVAIYGYVFTFAVQTAFVTCIYMATILLEDQSNIVLFPLLNYFVAICTLLLSGIASYGGIRRLKRTFTYFVILKKICYIINDNETKSNQKLTIMMFVYLISYAVYILISEMFIYDHNIVFIDCTNILFYFQMYQSLLLGIEIACIQLEIQQVLRKISKKLLQLNDGLNSDSITADTIRSKSEGVRVLTKAYITICELTSAVSDNSGGTMFLLLCNTIVCLTMSLYSLIDAIVLATNGRALKILLQMIWIMLYISTTLLFVEPCHRINEEVVEIKIGLARLIDGMTPVGRPIKLELDLMWKQLILNEPTISPLQLYTVQRSLLLKTIAFVTTYLVSIIQYIQNKRWTN